MDKKKIGILVAIIVVMLIAIVSCNVASSDGNAIKNTNSSEEMQKETATEETSSEATEAKKGTSSKSTEKKSSSTSAKKETSSTKNSSSSSSSKDSSSSSSSKNTSSTTKQETTKSTTHQHNWVAVYKEVDKGYYKTVTERVSYHRCNACGADITGNESDHHYQHALKGESSNSSTEYKEVSKKVWVPNIQKVVDYYKCSCGAAK